MRHFLKKILVYSSIVMIIFIAYELALLLVPNEYSYKKNYIKTHRQSLKILVLGNSHLADCIDPKLLGKNAFNAAQPGRSVYYDLQLMREFIHQMPNLECVVMPFSYDYYYWGHLYEKKHEPKFLTYRCMYLKYMNYTYSDGEWWHWSEILNSNYNHTGRLLDAPSKPLSDLTMCDSLGMEIDASYKLRAHDWDTLQLPSVTPLLDSTELKLNYKDNIKIYSEIATIMRNNHKRLILISMPIYKTARKRVSQRQIDEMYSFVKFLQSINPSIEFYNFIDDPRFIERDYYNSIHLNNEFGSRKITPIVRQIIESPPKK